MYLGIHSVPSSFLGQWLWHSLLEWSLPTPEISFSNPVIANFYLLLTVFTKQCLLIWINFILLWFIFILFTIVIDKLRVESIKETRCLKFKIQSIDVVLSHASNPWPQNSRCRLFPLSSDYPPYLER